MENSKIKDLRFTAEKLKLRDASFKLLILTVSIIFLIETLVN
ncbi:hypothetical protein I602_2429 [Polaribacter dokdonensis DSW-5]|jgi:hypothetical protein|uniref:Uncharacterized protein n=1 Tax=Polaribacter dokdonensis DSW-5 TaxID=1300348 RepID=A0A0M9CIJ0_9FLAO|nr:hypothetical protein I602_2429 [Polaribacter dokdonensis DSW-5]SEE53654.1 hypothetical protein SAMN05444353_2203 [Polaribacter dokdonensis DSW-5]